LPSLSQWRLQRELPRLPLPGVVLEIGIGAPSGHKFWGWCILG
jgi:hypothetical protein